MCITNGNGATPSCLEAQFGGPGAEQHGLCFQCANVLKDKNDAMQNALNKIHDLAGQIMGPDSHPNLGAIQDWVHQVSPCTASHRKSAAQAKAGQAVRELNEACVEHDIIGCPTCGPKDVCTRTDGVEHHCDHKQGWDTPTSQMAERSITDRLTRRGAIHFSCCWCGRERSEVHGRFLREQAP